MNQLEPTIIKEDNTGCIAVAENAIVKSRVKHIDIKHHSIRERIKNQIIKLQYVKTTDQLADIFTKDLPICTFRNFVKVLRLEMREAITINAKLNIDPMINETDPGERVN